MKIMTSVKRIKKAAKYISKHNPYNKSYEEVLESIMYNIRDGIKRDLRWVGTMGYMITFSYEDSGVDVDILVDPALDSECNYKTFDSIDRLDKHISSCIISL